MEQEPVNLLDFNMMSQEELLQEYKSMIRKHKELVHEHEESNQTIYTLKRSLQTATAAESYLNQELDLVLSNQSSEIVKINEKHSYEIEQWKQKYADLSNLNVSREKASDKLRQENSSLQQKLQDLEFRKQEEISQPSKCAESEVDLENINLDLLSKIDELQFKLNEYILITADRERKVENLKEEVHCLEENIQGKKEELTEKDTLLESLQDRLLELNAELASIKSQPECPNRKGNSLFAEVDDQRQAMRNMLASQKRQYLQMKSFCSESKNEIKRLKRENAAMQEELHACSTLFLVAEKTYKAKLNERIIHLMNENEKLRKKLRWTEDKVTDVGNGKDINWVDAVFEFCRNETEELKSQLRRYGMQKCALEHSLMESQQNEAKWRFEGLRSRCIIIDRENLLEEHGIKFRNANNVLCKITAEDRENAIPKIACEEQRNSTKSPHNKQSVQRGKLSTQKTLNHLNNVFSGLENEHPLTQDAVNLKTEIDVYNNDHLNTNELKETSENIVKPEVERETSEVLGRGDVKQENMEESPSEDVDHSPADECSNESTRRLDKQIVSDISVPEDASRKTTDIGHVNYVGQRPPTWIKNSSETQKNEFSHAVSGFQVYEDTTQHFSLANASLAREETSNHSSFTQKENLFGLNSESKPNESRRWLGHDSISDCPTKVSCTSKIGDVFSEGEGSSTAIEDKKTDDKSEAETSKHFPNSQNISVEEAGGITITRVHIG